MADKWRTTVAEGNAVFVSYGVHPSDLSTEALTRKWTGINRNNLFSLISTLRTTKIVTDPKADSVVYTGTWTVDSVDPVLDEGGNLAGSATIVQVLKKNVYELASPDNLTIIRSRAYPLEQNENAWMYYERYKSEVTKRWHNIKAANIEAEYNKLKEFQDFNSDHVLDTDGEFYVIGHATTAILVHGDGSPVGWSHMTTANSYWEPTLSGSIGAWSIGDLTELTTPIIRECWYEQNTDGTYNLFRTLETTTATAIMRKRPLQYAGMTLVQGYPMLDDTVLTIAGLEDVDEVVYKNARFRIGSDTYRVLSNSTASAGQVTVDVTPSITQATEDLCDAEPNQVQCFWDAL